ncbi:MAG: cob(I)yrinic acid a,c-diamide adenosyltransferase [Xanthomonadales bacterium]|nr:cob(I)yrinic acid a,c-diamide adenosyltransferase [Xanthomonadales bacterium]
MGHRLSRIVTRTGDDGTTGLADGSRVPKDAPRVAAFGTVDELNAVLGLLLAEALPGAVRQALEPIQHELFDLGGELALPGHAAIEERHVAGLESAIERFNDSLPPLREFILPGGGRAAALCHLARTVCRRAERETVRLARAEPVRAEALKYLNRLSDLLFVLARVIAREGGAAEVLWRSPRSR